MVFHKKETRVLRAFANAATSSDESILSLKTCDAEGKRGRV